MHSTRFVRVFPHLRVQAVIAMVAACTQFGQVAPALAAPIAPTVSSAVKQVVPSDDPVRLALPEGSSQCPASGPSVSCNSVEGAAQPTPGVSSLPGGQDACPARSDKAGPNAPASCNNTLLPTLQPTPTGAGIGTAFITHTVTPSIPIWTLNAAAGSQPRVRLESTANALTAGQSAVLTATANLTMTGTRSAIEIFDQTTGTLVGVCMQASQCLVAYAADSGVHTFAAYVTPPVANQPTENVVTSNAVSVSWFKVTLTSSRSIVGPGKAITITASTTADVGAAGFQLGLYDQTSGARLTYCSHGTTCSTSLTKEIAGTRSIVAYVSSESETSPPLDIQAQSAPISATWLGVTLDANTTHPQRGNSVFMRATANIDVTNTPWSIGIYDEKGELVGDACKAGSSCSARVSITTGSTPSFTAVIGAARPIVDQTTSTLVKLIRTVQSHASLLNVQVRSTPIQPTRLLWGVDSCKPFTSDPNAAGGLYPQVKRYYGSPDFWGRYLTNTYNCPGISSVEVAAAAAKKMGLLPIYNNYNCSAVHGYNTGLRYASEASTAATNLGIPAGTVLAIDIEPPGDWCPGAANVDSSFVLGWFDGITLANFAPMYYGNGTAGSEFASAWCRAVSARPEISITSYLWSFEPSLLGRFTKAKSPEYSPKLPGCAANMAAWQYVLSSGARPDVDSDEAISKLPLWFPTPAGS